MVRQTLPTIYQATLEVTDNETSVRNIAHLLAVYYHSLQDAEGLPESLAAEMVLDLARHVHSATMSYKAVYS